MKYAVAKCLLGGLVAVCAIGFHPTFAQVTSVGDTYSTPVDTPVDVAAPGVLSNDVADDSLGARLVAGPWHGEASLSTDGSLFYMPAPSFEGHDSLVYVAQVLQPIEFVIDSTSTILQLDAELRSSFGSDDDRETSRLGGTVAAFLLPHAPPFVEVHLAATDVVFLDELNFEFSVFFSTLHADVEAREMSVTMIESGGAVPGDGTAFDQVDNRLQLDARVTLSGAASSEERVIIDDTTTFAGSVELNAAGDTLRLTLPIEFAGVYSTNDADVEIAISDTVYATATYVPAVESAETIVRFDVGLPSTSIDASELPAATRLHPAYPNPFNPEAVVRYDLASDANVRLSLYDVTGREVARLVDRRQPAGRYDVKVEAGMLPSGVYLLRLDTGTVSRTGRIVLAK